MMKILLSLLLMVGGFLLPHEILGQEHTLNVIYTGAIKGELEPCGCSPKTDYGGLARLSGFLAAHEKSLSPYILIDAGNFSAKDTPQGRLKVDAMLKSFGIMKYDAVAFMSSEQAFPDDVLDPLIRKYVIPALSYHSNSTVSVSRDAFNVNISTDPTNCPQGKLNILLTDHPVAKTGSTQGCDVIISSGGETLEEPVNGDGSMTVSGYPKGKKLGILTLQIDDEGRVRSYQHSFRDLGNDIEEDSRVRNILDDYDEQVARLLAESERPPASDTYLGAAKCAECHKPFEESWKKTRHAHAFESLENVGKSNDPECIICHSVGYGEEGGFYSIDTTPDLANVQCEECHGLDREHIDDYSKPMKKVTKEVCLKCHTRENSPDFDYPVYLKKITH
jgi:hypothetical protein